MTIEHDDSGLTGERLELPEEDEKKPLVGFDAWWYDEEGAWAPGSWLLDGWLPAGEVSALVGEGGAGKTRLALQLATAVALADDRAEKPSRGAWWTEKQDLGPELNAAECGPVVWGSWETAPGNFQRRLRAAVGHYDDAGARLRERLAYYNMQPYGAIWGPEPGRHVSTAAAPLPAWDALLDAAQEREARLLVLDPLAAAYSGNENDRGLVRGFLSALADRANKANCAVLLISHPPKAGGAYSGSTDWLAGVQAQWRLDACKCADCEQDGGEAYRVLRVAKLNEGALPSPLYCRWSKQHHNLALAEHKPAKKEPRDGNRGNRGRPSPASSGEQQQEGRTTDDAPTLAEYRRKKKT